MGAITDFYIFEMSYFFWLLLMVQIGSLLKRTKIMF